MGQDKATIRLNGHTLLTRVHMRLAAQCEPIAISRPSKAQTHEDTPVITDTLPGFSGPLAGILSALEHFEDLSTASSHMLSVAVDTPFFPANLAKRLTEAVDFQERIVVARSQGRAHPVFALWPFSLREELSAWLGEPENRSLMRFIALHPYIFVDFPMMKTEASDLDPFFNINTPEDLEVAQKFAADIQAR